VPDAPGVPSAEELSALPAAELAARLAEAYRVIAGLTAQAGRLSARVEDLERQVRRDSSTSSRPPSSDSPYKSVGLGGVGFPRNLGCGAGAGGHGPVLLAAGDDGGGAARDAVFFLVLRARV
jgi:hypothetical protein